MWIGGRSTICNNTVVGDGCVIAGCACVVKSIEKTCWLVVFQHILSGDWMMIVQKLLNSRVAKNASWLIAGRIIQMILSFFVGLLTARYLGPGNYGLINYAATYTTFLPRYAHWASIQSSSRTLLITLRKKALLSAQLLS